MDNLRQLSIAQNDIGNEGIKRLSEELRNAENLLIFNFGETNIKDDGLLHISKNLPYLQHLQYLDLSNNDFSITGIEYLYNSITECECLHEIHINGCNLNFMSFFEIMKSLICLKNLLIVEVNRIIIILF